MILSKDLKQLDLAKDLTLINNEEQVFTSLLLQNADIVTSTNVSWDYKKLDSTRGLAVEGSDVEKYEETDRTTGASNTVQLLRKAVNVSDTAQAVSAEHITDLFAEELQDRILEIKRDLEFYLINGVEDKGLSTTPRQMNGLLKFVEKDNKITKAKLDILVLQEMAKKMKQAGTASQNMMLLCDYNTFDIVADLFVDKTYYQGVENEFGSPVQKLNLTYGSVVPYIIADMPADTALMVNLDYLKLGILQNRGLVYSELAKTGSSTKGMIEMENTLKVLHPGAITQFVKGA